MCISLVYVVQLYITVRCKKRKSAENLLISKWVRNVLLAEHYFKFRVNSEKV